MTESHDAETIFADWLSRRDAGETEPIDALARAHPGCADELRRMHDDWKKIVAAAAQESKREESLSDRLRDRFGSGVDPEVSLDGDATRAEAEAKEKGSNSESRLYDDLRERGPSSGRYRLEGEIAQGGMGAILRVYDKDLRRNLAMKVMLEEKEGRLSRFLEEAQVTGQLDHPGIVPVHELGIDAKGKVFFTMKLVKGRDLREVFDMVKAGAEGWSLTRAIDVLKRVCEAMAFAHEKNVIHRDLKPGNVMVGRHGEVYVMDWGLAKVLGKKETKDVRIAPASQSVVNTERRESSGNGDGADALDSPLMTMDGDAIGTPSYMPIEQAEGNLDAIGPPADVYAVGAMLYHLLAGNPPYVDGDERVGGRVILDRVKRGPPEPIRSLAKDAPIELIAICEKAMARKVAQRYPTIAALGDDLRAYLERRVVKAYRTGPIAETRAWIARNPVIAVGLLCVVIGVEAFVAWQRAQSETVSRAFDRVLRLSDVKDVRDVTARGKALLDDRGAVYRSYSGYDALIASQEQWIREAETLLVKLPDHERSLAVIESRLKVDPTTGEPQDGTKEERWWHSAIRELVIGLRALAADDPEATSIRAMRDRIAHNRSIFDHSIGEHRAEWEACIASIANTTECPAYNGLRIVPQVGLLPIGRDPQSGLWEFWFVDVTGVKPERGKDGKLGLADDFGIVFVLIPPLDFESISSLADNKANCISLNLKVANDRRVDLSAYLISKFELTQHQWICMSNDEGWPYGDRDSKMPADCISWSDAQAVLPTMGLMLPLSVQWEAACRAGTLTPFFSGSDPESLLGFANIRDNRVLDGVDGLDTVGNRMPNAFGLHDTHGNVGEWCRDWLNDPALELRYKAWSRQHASERVPIYGRERAILGGNAMQDADFADVHSLIGEEPGNRANYVGIRPCRDVTD